MGEILFMRHPQTVGNVAHLYSGRRNVELSDLGAAQCARAVQALVAWRPDTILTSPLVRCRSIAFGAALCLGMRPVIDDRLIEIDFGVLEGLTAQEARERAIAFPWPVGPDGHSVPATGGESFEHLMERASSLLAYAATLPGRTACVTHGGFMRLLLAAVYGMDLGRFWEMEIDNVSSLLFSVGEDRVARLCALGLTPAEVAARGRADAALEGEDRP